MNRVWLGASIDMSTGITPGQEMTLADAYKKETRFLHILVLYASRVMGAEEETGRILSTFGYPSVRANASARLGKATLMIGFKRTSQQVD